MIPEETILKILRSASKAPSGHNTQPWLFITTCNTITVTPDLKRALPVADPENRELYISLGCAVQNLLIAAQFHGYKHSMTINPLSNPCEIKIMLDADASARQSDLYPYINLRQSTPNAYKSHEISTHDLAVLKATVNGLGIRVRIFNGSSEIDWFRPYIAEAITFQMGNPAFSKELIQWMRFSEKEAMQHGDGLYSAAIGMPSFGRWMGSLFMKHMVSARSEEKRLFRLMDNTSALALITSEKDDAEHWIRTGMAFQQFALQATKLNLSYSFLNQPCQVAPVRKKVTEDLQLQNEFPQLLVRLGYSEKMPRSFRRRVSDVVVE
jgi:nitroreductase